MTTSTTGVSWMAGARRLPWQVVAPVVIYLALVAAGVTTSSIGIGGLRQDPSNPLGHQWGQSLSIRSDEFLTSSPYAIGVTATGTARELNPLSAPNNFVSQLAQGPASSIVLFDSALLRVDWLPAASLFAARWWLPMLLLVLGAPVYFRRITGRPQMGWFVAAMIIASPLTAWWSLSPLGMTGFTFAGAAAMLTCSERWQQGSRLKAVAWGAAAAVLLARTPLHYQPWAIVVAVAILAVAVVATVLGAERRKVGVLAVVAVGAGAALLLGGLLVEQWASVTAVSGTLYPGRRVATGAATGFGEIFGAAGLGNLEYTDIVGSNYSEISSSFAVAIILAVALATRALRFASRAHRLATMTAAGFSAFWFSWAMIDYGSIGERIPVVNLVPPTRAADVLGLLALLLLGLVLPATPARSGWRFGLLAAAATALTSGYAVSVLQVQNLPQITTKQIWAGILVVGVLAFMIATRPRHPAAYLLAVLAATSLVIRVNPVIVGLGDLRDSTVARQMRADGAALRSSGEVWASDSMWVDSLMIASGVPSLSGRQLAGPEPAVWRTLAPNADEATWNRGGAFIVFDWWSRGDVDVENPQPDVILVRASPCTVADRLPQLTEVISTVPLDQSCLEPAGTFGWSGQTQYRYTVERQAGAGS